MVGRKQDFDGGCVGERFPRLAICKLHWDFLLMFYEGSVVTKG